MRLVGSGLMLIDKAYAGLVEVLWLLAGCEALRLRLHVRPLTGYGLDRFSRLGLLFIRFCLLFSRFCLSLWCIGLPLSSFTVLCSVLFYFFLPA